ncbi:unnamed protein product [Rotaria magnacalcarata]|uniref:Uncharacterized protein n=2 Tax=Rotaria magnacalcarata TaxID=392030 RepID=A0A816QX54_9BILA|nr:unnamed protein product [Rotaria magnacalcarata]
MNRIFLTCLGSNGLHGVFEFAANSKCLYRYSFYFVTNRDHLNEFDFAANSYSPSYVYVKVIACRKNLVYLSSDSVPWDEIQVFSPMGWDRPVPRGALVQVYGIWNTTAGGDRIPSASGTG